ncbi:MAG: GNAT family N-acetyltransferase [Candidatus Limnocylindrales bacterium]
MSAELDRDQWHPATIDGRLVTLRRHRVENLATVVRWYRDPELAHLTRYQTRPMTTEEVGLFFRTRLLAPEAMAYAIHERVDDRLIGLTTFSALDPDNGSALFHITIGERDAWGRGLGTDATDRMLGHAFERLGLHRVGLSVFSFNERAIRAYQKVGFRVEGRLREAIWRDGRFFDELQMGVLASEWRAAREPHAVPAAAHREPLTEDAGRFDRPEDLAAVARRA